MAVGKPVPAGHLVFMASATKTLVESTAAFVAAIFAMAIAALAAESAPDLPRAAAHVTVTATEAAATQTAPRTASGLAVPRMHVAWPSVPKAGTAELDRR